MVFEYRFVAHRFLAALLLLDQTPDLPIEVGIRAGKPERRRVVYFM
jgi:hypothetical protein